MAINTIKDSPIEKIIFKKYFSFAFSCFTCVKYDYFKVSADKIGDSSQLSSSEIETIDSVLGFYGNRPLWGKPLTP